MATLVLLKKSLVPGCVPLYAFVWAESIALVVGGQHTEISLFIQFPPICKSNGTILCLLAVRELEYTHHIRIAPCEWDTVVTT